MFDALLVESLQPWLMKITPDFTSLDPDTVVEFFMMQLNGVETYDELRDKAIENLADFLEAGTLFSENV